MTATCQQNLSVWLDRRHVHECLREAGHRSVVHRCACGAEWWEFAGRG